MKMNKLALSAFAITVLTSSVALAENESKNIIAQQAVDVQLNTTTTVTPGAKASANASTTTRVQNERATAAMQANEERADDDRSTMGDSHRSAVATFVQKMLEVSDRERSIGAQVKAIAQAQNDSEKETTDTIVKIENRSAFKTFLFGTDYKNIGMLRSKMATTTNQLAELEKLAEKAVTAEDKTEIKAEIEAMEAEQVKIETFISAQENKFSLFGWLQSKK